MGPAAAAQCGVGVPGTPESLPTWCELSGRIPTAKYNFKVSGPCSFLEVEDSRPLPQRGCTPTAVLGPQQTQPAPHLWVTTGARGHALAQACLHRMAAHSLCWERDVPLKADYSPGDLGEQACPQRAALLAAPPWKRLAQQLAWLCLRPLILESRKNTPKFPSDAKQASRKG